MTGRGGPYRGDRWGGSEEGPVPLSEALGVLSRRMGMAGPDVLGAVFGRWAELVGPAMAAHVRPLLLQERTLVVAADHPAWATQARRLAGDILTRIGDACGAEHAPEHLEVRVRA
jgi:predicted nucleic acid-binding Zn ribbon protein